jgi:hypothetical protein
MDEENVVYVYSGLMDYYHPKEEWNYVILQGDRRG